MEKFEELTLEATQSKAESQRAGDQEFKVCPPRNRKWPRHLAAKVMPNLAGSGREYDRVDTADRKRQRADHGKEREIDGGEMPFMLELVHWITPLPRRSRERGAYRRTCPLSTGESSSRTRCHT